MTTTAGSDICRVHLDWGTDPRSICWVGRSPLYQYWPVLAPYFRDVLLPPQRKSGQDRVAWQWRDPARGQPLAPQDIGQLRARMQAQWQWFLESEAGETLVVASPSEAHEANRRSIAQLRSAMEAWIQDVCHRPDQELARFVARTPQGLRLHSWGAWRAAETEAQQRDEIGGRVRLDGRPLGNCVITVMSLNTGVSWRVHTDASGDYVQRGLANGSYLVEPASANATFSPRRLEIRLGPAVAPTADFEGSTAGSPKAATDNPRGPTRLRVTVALVVLLGLSTGAWFYLVPARPAEGPAPRRAAPPPVPRPRPELLSPPAATLLARPRPTSGAAAERPAALVTGGEATVASLTRGRLSEPVTPSPQAGTHEVLRLAAGSAARPAEFEEDQFAARLAAARDPLTGIPGLPAGALLPATDRAGLAAQRYASAPNRRRETEPAPSLASLFPAAATLLDLSLLPDPSAESRLFAWRLTMRRSSGDGGVGTESTGARVPAAAAKPQKDVALRLRSADPPAESRSAPSGPASRAESEAESTSDRDRGRLGADYPPRTPGTRSIRIRAEPLTSGFERDEILATLPYRSRSPGADSAAGPTGRPRPVDRERISEVFAGLAVSNSESAPAPEVVQLRATVPAAGGDQSLEPESGQIVVWPIGRGLGPATARPYNAAGSARDENLVADAQTVDARVRSDRVVFLVILLTLAEGGQPSDFSVDLSPSATLAPPDVDWINTPEGRPRCVIRLRLGTEPGRFSYALRAKSDAWAAKGEVVVGIED